MTEIVPRVAGGLLAWYDFRQDAEILYIGEEADDMLQLLRERGQRIVVVPYTAEADGEALTGLQGRFDYVIAIAALERVQCPRELLSFWKSCLKPEGVLLLGMNNRFGLRYFCGDRDPYTERNFDGVENYRRAYGKKEDGFAGRMYSEAEIKKLLEAAGFFDYVFYAVLSDLQNPVLLYREGVLPKEDLANRLFPTYHYPDTVFLEEENLYASLAENGMFHQMANAYLVECPLAGEGSDVCQVTSSMERAKEDALLTVLRKNHPVEKRAVYPEGQARLEELIRNGEALKQQGVRMVDARIEEGVYKMPYIEAEVGQVYLKKLLHRDKEQFLQRMDEFRDCILRSSRIEVADKQDGNGAILEKGYLDMVPLNSFYVGDGFVFFDQEFCREHYPANVILMRMVATFYAGNPELEKLLPMDELLQRYGLLERKAHWLQLEWDFLAKLRREEELLLYHRRCRRNPETLHSNRQRMNYSEEEYQRRFVDIFRNADSRRLVLFGSGRFTQKFLALYQKEYPVYAIVDNNPQKWGQEYRQVPICSPKLLEEAAAEEYKVIICIKNYLAVKKQLEEMGIRDYSIYDAGKSYPKRQSFPLTQSLGNTDRQKKKYPIGYVAGVFDLFHIGHLNLLRKASEQCEYLIVGIVPDEEVWRQKKKYPVIAEAERLAIVSSCRYVSRAEILPPDYSGIRDAYRMFGFDCQFSGDDHGDSASWQADREFLQKQGADLVFLEYTKSTSSTKIREDLRKMEQKAEKKRAEE